MRRALMPVLLLAVLLPGGWGRAQAPLGRAEAFARAAALTELGRQMFFDPRLSASGQLACASCHDPAHGFSPPNDRPVQWGGPHMDRLGVRAAPGLTYLQAVPAFTEHFHDSPDDGDESVDNGPTGGLTWDGRADGAAAQAEIPLLSPEEMANASPGDLVARARAAGYVARLAAIEGTEPDTAALFAGLAHALAAFQQDPATFYPYDSKYDAVLAGRTRLSAQEARGLEAFNDPARGNCASCHLSAPGKDGSPPHFSDYGLIALGLPRNRALPANADPAFFDLGLCGPFRQDLADHPDYCGRFRTPGLRNVALKRVFFHNGVLHSLRDAVAFYATRDTDPARWYPNGVFNDLPPPYRANLNAEPPFEGRTPGGPPALTEAEIDDIVAFLSTLSDHWRGE